MIALQVADLVVIAGRVLEVDTTAALDLVDLCAAEAAVAATPPELARNDPADQAAALLHALVRHHPLRRGNKQVALAATLQFLALNGWQADLDPPEAATAVLAELTAGTLGPAGLADWLAPRLRTCDDSDPCAKETPMRRWLPGRKRLAQPKDKFRRFTNRARQVMVLSQDEARRLNHNYIGTEHLLLGLIREGDGVAAQVLVKLGAEHARLREQVLRLLAEGTPESHRERGLPSGLSDLDRYDQQLAKVRWVKEAAIDAQDFDTAAVLRVAEQQLLDKRAQRERECAAGADIDAVVEENRRLHQQVDRLRTCCANTVSSRTVAHPRPHEPPTPPTGRAVSRQVLRSPE